MLETAKTTSLVFIILLGAAMLTAAFRAFGGEELVRNFLNSMPGGFWAKFGIVMAVIFVLGFFLDFIEIAVVVVPIVAPILLADPSANITAVWLGVMIGLNIQTSFLTPPFGFALFYLRGVAPPSVKTLDIYKGVVAFICLQLLALGIVGYYPQLVNYLPNRVSLLSESSPPPRNPKLQICLEEYSMMKVSDNRADITSAIYTAQSLDTSFLPKKISSQLNEAFGLAEVALSSLEEVFTAEEIVANSEENYRPILVYVRGIESSIRRAEGNAKSLNDSLAYLKADADVSERERVLEDIASIELQVQELKEKIPNDWDATYGTFSKLVQTENKARMTYRRSADQSVVPVIDLVAVFRDNSDFRALKGDLLALEAMISQEDAADVEFAAKTLAKAFSAVKGTSKVSSALKKVARQLRAGKINLDKARSEYKKALKVYQSQEIWRSQAEGDFEVALEVYLSAMSESIGARQQERLTRDQALYIAKCNADHRDVSLNF